MDLITEKMEKLDKKAYAQQYFRDNKQKIYDNHKEYRQITMLCECGCTIKSYNKALHKRSKKHIQLMELQNKINELLLEKKNNI